MILNTTRVAREQFSAMQTLAARGETIVTQAFESIEAFIGFYDLHANNVTTVLVAEDEQGFEFINDIYATRYASRVASLRLTLSATKTVYRRSYLIYHFSVWDYMLKNCLSYKQNARKKRVRKRIENSKRRGKSHSSHVT